MTKYKVRANLEGVDNWELDVTFRYRWYAMKVVKLALKAGMIVHIVRVK